MKLFSWGSNSHGQLAQGRSDDLIVPTENIHSTCSFEDILSITGGGGHSLIITKNGLVYSSGSISKEECCQNDKTYGYFLKVNGLSCYKITQVTAGWDFSIVLTDESRVFTWGSNSFGQLGVTGIIKSLHPIEIFIKAEDGDTEKDSSCMVSHIVAGMRHSMALTISGDVFVWGAGRKGQLGIKISENLPIKLEKPKKLNGISGVQSLVAGAFHSGALLKDGSIYVWGCNKYGQSTNREVKMLTEPYEISSHFPLSENDTIKELYSGWSHFLVLTERRQVISWGRCDYGQLGRPTDLSYNNCDPKPCIVEDLGLNVKQLRCGAEHNLALLGCGSLVCWGWNEHGMCGNGTQTNQLRPIKVQLPEKSSIDLIGTGTGHSFAICSN